MPSLGVLLSEFIIEELRRTLPRLSHRHGLDQPAIDDLIDALAILTDLVTPSASQALTSFHAPSGAPGPGPGCRWAHLW